MFSDCVWGVTLWLPIFYAFQKISNITPVSNKITLILYNQYKNYINILCIFLILFLVLFEKMLYNGIIPKESSWLRGIFFLCASSYNRLGFVEHTNAASFLTALTYFYLLWTSLYISSIPAVINGRNFIFCKGFFKPYHFIQQNSPTEKR